MTAPTARPAAPPNGTPVQGRWYGLLDWTYREDHRSRRLVVDREAGYYYVSVVDGPRLGLLLGPFRKHQQARRFLKRAKERAMEVNLWAVFYGFGTVRMADGDRAGVLNADLGIVPLRRRRAR
jgi:hypothetical protein